MFRKMRRIKQELPQERNIEILNKGITGTLAVLGDEGYPYTVPLNYIYDDDKIYFHCAKTGHKIDAIKANDKVSFCVIDKDTIVQEKYTTFFRSVVVFGRARILEDDDERRDTLKRLAEKYSPDYKEGIDKEVEGQLKAVSMVEISIEHMTGKEAIELVNAAKK